METDLCNRITNQLSLKIIKQREDQILNVLKENGFEFERGERLNHFMRTKCEIQIIGKLNRLLVDGNFLCEWDDSYDIKIEGNEVQITAGILK